MIEWSTVAFGCIQLVIVAVHYHLSFGHAQRLSTVEDALQSMRGKMNNARGDARKEARKVAEEATQDVQEQTGGQGMDMNPMMMWMMSQMFGNENQNGQDEEAPDVPTLGSGGIPDELQQ